jgi:hypothetical protein
MELPPNYDQDSAQVPAENAQKALESLNLPKTRPQKGVSDLVKAVRLMGGELPITEKPQPKDIKPLETELPKFGQNSNDYKNMIDLRSSPKFGSNQPKYQYRNLSHPETDNFL